MKNADLLPPTQEEVQDDLAGMFRGAVRMVLETLLEQETRKLVGDWRWGRWGHRTDVRNGSFFRRLLTTMGWIDIKVSRTRKSGSPVEVLGRYKRRARAVDAAITEAYVGGVSTRNMKNVTRALVRANVARSTVSRITRELEGQVEALRSTPLTEPIAYLYLDATFLDTRWARKVENVAALVAYGVGPDGHRNLLGVTIGAAESEDSWAELLRQLLERGLSGVRLVIADAHAGLAAAVRHQLPEAKLQRCIVHLQRNAVAKAPHRMRGRVAREVTRIFAAQSLGDARRRLALAKQELGPHVPEAIACIEEGFSAATQFYAFPKQHWPRIRTTNGLERLHGEIKRRIRSAGAFPDRASALRLIVVVALRTTDRWRRRVYLEMSLLDHAVEKELAA
jgi:transposase-like protein